MTDWEQLIAESQSLEERASKIQDGKVVGLPKAEIGKLTRDYHSWFAKCLSLLPEDLKSKFREEYEGSFWNAKIKKFFEAATELSPLHLSTDAKAIALLSPWAYPYTQNFYPYILSQRQILIEASERQESAVTKDESSWNATIRRVFKVFIEKANEAETPHAKKLTFEYLAIFLISAIDGLTIIGHDKRGASEEIDLWVANDSTDSFWHGIGSPFIVECKNWGNPVGVQEVRSLSSIMESKNTRFAILLAKNGITGDTWHDAVDIIRQDFRKGKYIVVLDQSDLVEIANGVHPTKKIRQKYHDLFMKS